MPRHPFKKYMSGERLSGMPKELLNAVVESERGFTGGSGDVRGLVRDGDIVKVKNTSGAARSQYQILGLDGPIITPTQNVGEFKRRVTFKGITPTTASHPNKFVVLLEPLGINAIGDGILSGVVQVRLTGALLTGAKEDYAAVTDSDAAKLTRSSIGTARILWADSGSSERWAIVRLGQWVQKLRGKFDGSLSFGGSATMSIWYYNGSADADTGENVTVYDWHLSTGQTVASGKQVSAFREDASSRWILDATQCA